MKILFYGDSITLGQQGVSNVNQLKSVFPETKFTNIARNPETLNMMEKRLLRHLNSNSDYIVLAGGPGDAHLLSFLKWA